MKRVREYINKHNLIEEGDRVLVGVSGGADSICLLFVLRDLMDDLHFSLHAVHVNHGLRGQEAKRDEDYVRAVCGKLGVPCKVYEKDVRRLAKERKIGTEEAGRMARQEAFMEYAQEVHATKIALAHHKNDQAETMLHHLARGTGLAGLCSIKPMRGMIIRPLLCMNRKEIEHYLIEHEITYFNDSTNEEDDYTRNKIRHHVLPQLESINEKAVDHMADTSAIMEKAEEYLSSQGHEAFLTCSVPEENGMLLQDSFLVYADILQFYMVREAIQEAGHTFVDVTQTHLHQIEELFSKEVGKSVDLPGNLLAKRTYEGVWIGKSEASSESKVYSKELVIPGKQLVESMEITCQILPNEGEPIPEKTYTKWLDYDKIKDMLVVRNRRDGDYLVINDKGGTKKLKDYFIDEKVPREIRDEIPLLAKGKEILWVVGYRISEAYKVTSTTKEILKIQVQGGKIYE